MPERQRFAAESVNDTFDVEEIINIQNDSGTFQAQLYVDEKDELQVTLLEYDQKVQGQRAVVLIPACEWTSSPVLLTGEPVSFPLGSVSLPETSLPEVYIQILPEQ